MNKISSKIEVLEEKSLGLSVVKRTRKNHRPKNKVREAPPKSLKSMIHLTMNLNRTHMNMSLPSSLAKSTRYGETKVGPSAEALQEECLETRWSKKKVL